MSIGKQKLLRKHTFWQSIAIFGTEGLDLEAFLYFGRVHKMTSDGFRDSDLDDDLKEGMAELQAFAEKKYQEEKAINPDAVFKLPVTEWLQMKAQRKQESQGKES